MKSYLKFLSRNKLYTAIQAVGLIVSLAFVILIGSYVRQQWQVARGAPEWRQYYAVSPNREFVNMSPNGLARLIKENIPDVGLATMYAAKGVNPNIGGQPFHGQSILQVEPDFLKMFPVEMAYGRVEDLLGGGIAVSEEVAVKCGLDPDLRGTLYINGKDTLEVSAVFRSLGAMLFSEADYFQVKDFPVLEQASYGGTSCLIGTSLPEEMLKPSLNALFKAHEINKWRWDDALDYNGTLVRMDGLYFSDLNRAHLGFRKGNRSLLVMLLAVVLLLLLSAVFNYINLSAALAMRRVKEMGMRSIMGASRTQIFVHSLLESLLFTVLCTGLALLVARAFTPLLTKYVEVREYSRVASAPFAWHWDVASVGLLVLLTVLLGLMAGWIPTRVAAGYDAAQIVKGDYRSRNKRWFSKLFIVFQSALAVVLISFALVLERQYSHMIHRPAGARVEDLYEQLLVSDAHADAVAALPFVEASARANGVPGKPYMSVGQPKPGTSEYVNMSLIQCDSAAFALFGFDILEDYHTPSGTGVWCSESAFNALEMDRAHPVLPEGYGLFRGRDLAGVVRDFALSDAAHIDPDLLGFIIVDNRLNARYEVLKIRGDKKAAEKELKALYSRFSMEKDGYEGLPELSGYVSDLMKSGLQEAERYMRLMELFMVLAVIVSLLGLLAMSALFASEQTHDVAVRKVHGSTVGGEVLRGVREYMLLVGIACVLAIPVAVWLSARYLQDFQYRISGYGWVFAVAVVIAVLISLASVLWQTLRAARTNPAVELKKE